MKLYAVMVGYDYEGETLKAIYETKDKALTAIKENFSQYPAKWEATLWRGDSCTIEEITLNCINKTNVIWESWKQE